MLIFMVLVSFSLITWHVWIYGGPAGQATHPEVVQKPFPLLLGTELWDLLLNPHGILAELRDIFPYFIVGILLAGYIRTYKFAVKLRAAIRRFGFLSIFLASLVGILTPLCACGTLTTAVSLLFAGLPLAPVMALLVTSPLMSPSTYLLTLNDLGPEWTVIRTISAFALGIFAGTITHLLRDKGFQTDSIFIENAIPRGDFHDDAYPDERLRCNCKEKFGNRIAARTNNMFVIFLAKSSEMLWLVGKYVLVGVTIGAIVERYLPYEWIYRLFGRKDPLNIVWVTLCSVPIFVHQISASSILYHIKQSLHGTLDGGAGLAFLIGGPVTAMPTMVLFWTMFKKRVFILYMFICIVGTIMIAYAFQFLMFVPYVDMGNPLLRGVTSLSGGNSSIIEKQSNNVWVVMDPGGKSIIATYTNDLEGQGGIIFDSGPGRFLNSAANKYDNRKYIQNIAVWLKENNQSSTKRSILIYEAFPQSGKDPFSPDAERDLVQQGFHVRITDRRETPAISERMLNEYGQLWFFLGEPNAGQHFTHAEMETISRYTANGKSMLIVAGTHGENNSPDITMANQLSSRYGVQFSGTVQNKEELPATTMSYFLQRTSIIIGKILKFVHKA
jgi:uncharacterized protein